MLRRDFLARSAGLGLASLAPPRPATWESVVAFVETTAPKLIRDLNVPGLSIAIVRDGAIRYRRGFGVKDAGSGSPVDTDTMFEAQSMSKPVFAYVVMKLCENGVIDLDRALTKYGPPLAAFQTDDPRLNLVTARHVLSHTTGFPNWRSERVLPIQFTPGERFQYSGEGYCFLQSVATFLTGRAERTDCARFEGGVEFCGTDFEAHMRKNLLDPFGMTSSGYAWTERFARLMARPHDRQGKPMENRKSKPPAVARYGSSGALLTTPADYARFLNEMLGPKPPDAFRLGAQSLSEMARPHVQVAATPEYTISWGLGWRIARTKNYEVIGHGGDNPGFHCHSELSPARRSGYVIMTNGDNGAELLKNFAPELSNRLYSL